MTAPMRLTLDAGYDQRVLRRAFGRFATGVTIVTCVGPDGQPVGLTVSSFGSLSLEPPLVFWSLRQASSTLAAFTQARRFAVNVLGAAQVELSRRFASQVHHKFAAGAWSAGLDGVPVLAGCAAVFECERTGQHDAGDHLLFIGRVLALSEAAVAPLVYQAGHYRHLGDIV